MQVNLLALPFAGAAAGALAGGAFGLLVAGLWALAGAPDARALDLASWALFSGVFTGALMATCRALDRWWTEPGTEEEDVRDDVGASTRPAEKAVRVSRFLSREMPALSGSSGRGLTPARGGTTFPLSERRNKEGPPSRR